MDAAKAPPSKKALLIKLAVAALVLGVGALMLLRGVDIRGLMVQTKELIQDAGPVVFFGAAAILPAVGFPVSMFTFSAGPVFAEKLGLGVVIALILTSMTLNLALTYWLARYAFRPLLAGLIKRLGYKVPEVSAENRVGLTLLVRITPGPPFFAQSYLLGLAEIPFKIYMLISFPVAGMYWVLAVVFGDSLMKGKGLMVVIIAVVLVVLGLAMKRLRKRLVGGVENKNEAGAT